jgi:hypothetical protein
MREVYPGTEYRPTVISVMIDFSATQHADTGVAIENGEVGRHLHRIERGIVLGIEKARIGRCDMDGLASFLNADGSEINGSIDRELRHKLFALTARQQHRVAKVQARLFDGQDMREKETLIDLDSVLVSLRLACIGRYFGCRRAQSGYHCGGSIDELVHAQETGAVVGQSIVERTGMGAEKSLTSLARRCDD